MTLQQARHREDRADAHFIGLAASHGKASESAQHRQSRPFSSAGFHHHAGRGPVGELGGIACGDELVRTHHRGQLGQRLISGAWAIAVVGLHRYLAQAGLAAGLVGDLHGGGAGHDLVTVASGFLCLGGLALAGCGEAILVFARDAVACGHDVGGLDHGQVEVGLVLDDPRVHAAVAAVGGAAAADLRDAFHTACDHGVSTIDHDAAGRHRNGLQARGTEAVDGSAGDADGQPRAHDGLARDVAPGSAFRIAAAEDGVLDLARIDARTLDGRAHRKGRQGRTGRDVEFAAMGLGQGGTRSGYDDGFPHHGILLEGWCNGETGKARGLRGVRSIDQPAWFSDSKLAPRSTSSTSSGEGVQNSGSSAAKARMSASTLGRPTMSAYFIGPPRWRGKP